MSSSPPERISVFVCPDCGEQITQPDYTPELGQIWGHFHDPPKGWHADEGPSREDPWIDAQPVTYINAERVEALTKKWEDYASDATVRARGSMATGGQATVARMMVRDLRALLDGGRDD